MSRRVEALLEAARQVEVAEPPPLAAIRAETGVRARRSAYLAAFALALPLGAAAAAGGWAIKQRVDNAPRAAPKQVRPRADVPRAFAPAQQAPAMDEARPAAPGPAETSAGSSSMAKAESADAPSAAWPARVAGGSSAEPGRMAKAAVADAPSEARPARATPQADDSLREAPRREASRTPGVVAADGRQVPSATAEQRAVQPSTSHAIAPTPGAAQVDAPTGNAAPPDRPDRTFGVLSSPSELKQPKVPETPAAGGAPASTALSQEAAALTAMLATLRQDHQPTAALTLVAQYRARFPAGALGSEVTLVAAEAHRALGQTAEALAELEKLTVDARGGELTVLRAELRAELGHCAEARSELDLVRGRLSPALRERAERVEAACR